jgi:ribosomal protein L44E
MMAQVYKCEQCGNVLQIPDERVIYAAYCKNDSHEMEKVSDRQAERAVAEAERIVQKGE